MSTHEPTAVACESTISALAPPARRRRWVSVLLSVVIFASGFVVGGATLAITARNALLHAIHHPEEAPAHIAQRLRHKLSLTDEQTQQVEEIIRRRQHNLEAIRRVAQPQVLAELDSVEQEISAVLTPEQRANWEARFQELRDTWTPPLSKEPSE